MMRQILKAQIFNYNEFINQDLSSDFYSGALKKSGFNVISFQEHNFDPVGYTALWLLGESHFALHTFPEENSYYIELSSCNESFLIKFQKIINDKIGAK